MFDPDLNVGDIQTLKYILTHVFCPLRLPDGDDHTLLNDYSLAGAVCAAARAYTKYISSANLPQWNSITRMLENLHAIIRFEKLDQSEVASQLRGMRTGDILTFLVRAQNAAVIFRKQAQATICESMEVSPMADAVMGARGKLVCSYPGPAIEVPNDVFSDGTFTSELANFLSHMHEDILDSAATSKKAQTTVVEERDTAHPRYITELLTGILRAVGRPADIVRITKRVGDDVVWNNSRLPWRRSSLWLLIRVAMQTSLQRSALGLDSYKEFMIFFMCDLAEKGICADLSNDLLHCISTKISRRLGKLGHSPPEWLSSKALKACQSLRSILEERWIVVQDTQRESPFWAPSHLDLVQDTKLSLLGSRDYIRNSLTNHHAPPDSTSFQPDHHPRGTLDDFLDSDGSFFEAAYRAEPHVTLHDIEKVIEEGIDGWVARSMAGDRDEACRKLERLANKYSCGAQKTYKNNPEHLSIMLLTTIELWIALDKLAIAAIPILSEYSPEVPTSLLESFLLRKSPNLRRLRRAHQYIYDRHSRSYQGSVFSERVSRNTFAVRYYNDSKSLQELKADIEAAAEREVELKIVELERANAHRSELLWQSASASHSTAINRYGNEYHPHWCDKCHLSRWADQLTISVHEWPLPTDPLRAMVVVFELHCPLSFNMWRAATFHLLLDLCSPQPEAQDVYILLENYRALQPYLKRSASRITLGSDTKPFIVTHYNSTSIPSTKDRVCVKNGLQFYGFDSQSQIPVSEALGSVDAKRHCTYKLPSGRYHNLQKYVDSTTISSNEVLASQADCHNDLSIHEFISFGHLRSGGLIQWLNILRELRERTLSFRADEVHLLVAQAASEVGQLADAGQLAWHQELQQPSFCYAFLKEIESLIVDVEANWLEGVTMGTISFLLGRLLASKPGEDVVDTAIALLRRVREKTFSWVKELSDKLMLSPEDEDLRRLSRDMAATCRGTYDVCPSFIPKLLRSPNDVEILLSCSIFIHDNTPSDLSETPLYSQLLLDRDRRLSLSVESTLRDIIQGDTSDEGIDRAIHRVWPGYRPGSKWQPLPHPNSRWFSCKTSASENQCSQTVHFNSLDGTLLVDGKPLSRLPSAIMQHPVYRLIFGKQVFDVIPSDIPGMDFLTRGMISEHQVYFSLKGKDLAIRAKHKDAAGVFELIPQGKLEEDLPTVLVSGHAHWLNLSTSTIEVRHLDKLWEHSSENWEIACTPGHYCMRKGDERLVDIRSPAWTMVSDLLKPLDVPQNLIVTVSTVNSPKASLSPKLSVVLPRYSLSFFVNEEGELQSQNLSGMVYDANQSTGTLFGLVNQLVLRPKCQVETDLRLVPRCILIPEGDISFSKHGHHVRVEINTHSPPLRPVTYQTYRVDSELGCLTGNVSLTNKLYRAYLHALTSGGCNIDPLTGRTGTEEALCLLRSASCRSIMKVGSHDAELLCLIASLCPKRTWYPKHLRCMHSVSWLSLPVAAQHHELYTAAKEIKEHCDRLQPFHQNSEKRLFQKFAMRDDHLLERSAFRAIYLFPSEVSGQLSVADHDIAYQARHLIKPVAGELRAYTAAYAVRHRLTNTLNIENILHLMESWKTTIDGKASLSLRYDGSWLKPDLPSIWLEAYNLLRCSGTSEQYQLLFTLPAMAYGSPNLSNLVPTLIAFATDQKFRSETPPYYASYDLSDGYCASRDTLSSYIRNSAKALEDSPENALSARLGESHSALVKRRWEQYNSRLHSDTGRTVDQLLNAWPSETPPRLFLDYHLYDVSDLTSKLANIFSSWHRNLKLKEHLIRVQRILGQSQSQTPLTPHGYSFTPSFHISHHARRSLTTDQLFSQPAPLLPACSVLRCRTPKANGTKSPNPASLQQLIADVQTNAKDPFHREYASDLHTSAAHFGNEMPIPAAGVKMPSIETLRAYYDQRRARLMEGLQLLCKELGPRSTSEQALSHSGQWPRITAHALFRYLALTSPIALPEGWKKCLIRLALLTLEVQRARRLYLFRSHQLSEELFRELRNPGCDGWSAEQYPDWLLIQLQGNFLVRRVQVDVAMQMISPSSGENSASQLHMGEGKSSVIVPICVAALADGTQMVRVIVPKALTAQMFQLLVDRLGGLADRPIYYLPFSRSVQLNVAQAANLHSIMTECMNKHGILVVQPEHILSLKLVTVEKQLVQTEESRLADLLLKLQKWLHSRARDILDESDEILHVRYQLVYTIGLQQHMEGFPERWTTTQQVLTLVKKHAATLRDHFPRSVEYEPRSPGAFPHFRILQLAAGEELVTRIAEDAMRGLLPNFSFEHSPSGFKDAIHTLISCKDVPLSTARAIKDYLQDSALWGNLLLLRGLLATGILVFAFKERRWRVDYGLAPERTMLAVPYRAKDVPAQRAEFGHPDVAIILTCLSYYYGGLSEDQLKISFEILLKEDDPSIDYDLWVQDCHSVPETLRKLSGINIKSTEQWQNDLFPLFSRNQATINFYLSRVVFPKEAKEFPSKLSCSGWDLAERRDRLITGFSGTNDGRYLLPKSITQHDPDHQRGTNARLLSYLLQPENGSYMLTTHENGERRTTSEFLEMVAAQTPEIRVLLDVGAQMLDLQNRQLAETWLKLSPSTSAAIYFNEDDELTVLTRDGRTQLLLSSPFAQQLDQCVIYLDDAHTRGTDIKFPRGFRAAVTLGPKVTKDRLAQGCMRMRKLGHGHSVMFFAPLEIDRSIRTLVGKGSHDIINASDILHWAIRETCNDIQQRAPHWAQQGTDHASRYHAWTRFCDDEITPQELSGNWLQPEAKSLVDLYAPYDSSNPGRVIDPEILRHCLRLGVFLLRDVSMDEEQEREVIHEIERERQVERPPKAVPAKHAIHQDVVEFVRTGIIPRSRVFRPIFQTLSRTSAATDEADVWSSYILASQDFSTTIVSSAGRMDEYLRPVHWVISGRQGHEQPLVLLSPYEVNHLLPSIRQSNNVRLHLYTPRTSRSMKPCDDLKLYAIPTLPPRWIANSTLVDQLNVFAGQLYLRDHATYVRLCHFLCVYVKDLHGEEDIEVESDGFIAPHNRPPTFDTPSTSFQHSPLPSLRRLIGLRRKGLRFAPTHMGKITEGRLLTERDFDD